MDRRRYHARPRWLWPVSSSLAVGVIVLLWLVPASWWDTVWPRGDLHEAAARVTAAPVLELLLVEVERPRPVVEVIPDPVARPSTRMPSDDPDWWDRAWTVRIDRDLGRRGIVLPDTLVPGPLRDLWGSRATVALIMSTPDSAVRARLWQLVEEEELRRTDLDGLFTAIARARAYVDKKRREAAIYGEFGVDQIRVPD